MLDADGKADIGLRDAAGILLLRRAGSEWWSPDGWQDSGITMIATW
jgi:hypothetical protein